VRGADDASARSAIIDAAVSCLFAPNCEPALYTLHFRDGKSRPIYAGELVSGRLIEQICRAAGKSALLRPLEGGPRGMTVSDMQRATSEAIDRLARLLTLRNVREYLADLPEDIDVVRIERHRARASGTLRYLNAA